MSGEKITIFIPLSRDWRIKRIAEQIEALDFADFEVDLLIVCDNLEISKYQIETAFSEGCNLDIRIEHTGNVPQPELSMNARRARIADIFTLAQKLIRNTDFVLTIEDDTDFPPDTLTKLFQDYFTKSLSSEAPVGFVSGVQAGRWGFKINGVWNVDNPHDVKEVRSVMLNSNDQFQKVSAAGFYCFVCSKQDFCRITHLPYFGVLGPDVSFGIQLSKLGCQNYIDQTLLLGHDVQSTVIYPDNNCVQVAFGKNEHGWVRLI